MMWSSEHPHNGNDWPSSPKVIGEAMGALPAAERMKITGANAARIWRLDGPA